MDTKDYQIAINHFYKAITFLINPKDSHIISQAFNNIGIASYQSDDFEESISALEKAKIYNKKENNKIQSANISFNMALCYYDLEKFQKASTLLEKAIKIYEKSKFTERVLLCQINLYRVFYKLKKIDYAKSFERVALIGIDTINNITMKIDFYTYLSKNYLADGDSTAALNYSLLLLKAGKEVFNSLENQNLKQLKTDISYQNITNQLTELQTNHNKVLTKNIEIIKMNSELTRLNKWVIFLSVGSLILFLGFIILLLKSNRKKKANNVILANQKEELHIKNNQILNSVSYANSMEKLLLQQMNPHFLFNALTTIEASIAVREIDFAKSYISMFADLLRKTLDYSRNDSVSLIDEISFLKSYIDLNSIKQGNDFSYEFIYSNDKVEDFVYTPPMLVQPFIENALIHGLYHKTDGKKQLVVQVQPMEDYIIWTISDNGIGRVKSKEIGKTHKGVSHGIKITSDRVKWMENIYGHQFSIAYKDIDEGTIVTIKTPIVEK